MSQSEELRKVTLNLFDSDVDAMEQRYGWGWSETVRILVRRHLKGLLINEAENDDQ